MIRVGGRLCKTVDELEQECAGGVIVYCDTVAEARKQVADDLEEWRERRLTVRRDPNGGRFWELCPQE